MDVTPSKKMFETMQTFTDAVCGEEPTKLDHGPGAQKRRAHRRMVMDFLHNIIRLSMRVGVARYRMERGLPVVEDQVRPNPLKKAVSDSFAANDRIIAP